MSSLLIIVLCIAIIGYVGVHFDNHNPFNSIELPKIGSIYQKWALIIVGVIIFLLIVRNVWRYCLDRGYFTRQRNGPYTKASQINLDEYLSSDDEELQLKEVAI